MTTTIAVELTLETLTCIHQGCGLTFAVPTGWTHQRRRDHSLWYCPNGHQQGWTGKTEQEKEIDRLKAALETESAARLRENDRARRLENDPMDQAMEMKRRQRRHVAGTCPFCQRSFANMARHIASQHPGEHDAVLQTSRTKAAKAVAPTKAKKD